MKVDVIIVGQGICGTWLSLYMEKAGISFIVIDESRSFTASKISAGIINPVTGRRLVETWMIDELLPFVWNEYQSFQNELDIQCISEKTIVEFFPSPQMVLAFRKRYEEEHHPYLHKPDDETKWIEYFNYEFGYGEIRPGYLVDAQMIISAQRKKLITGHQLLEEHFTLEQLIINENKINYKDISADKIIFCDGVESFNNPYFRNLPFAPNKGEALIIETGEIPEEYIFKKGINIVPWKKNLFWVGSSYEWQFQDDQPSNLFRKKTETLLKQWLRHPFKTVDHLAAIRPATLERRPFVGFHPVQSGVGILNGMGTKGCSLAPYFAKEMVQYLTGKGRINRQADVQRFSHILSRNY